MILVLTWLGKINYKLIKSNDQYTNGMLGTWVVDGGGDFYQHQVRAFIQHF